MPVVFACTGSCNGVSPVAKECGAERCERFSQPLAARLQCAECERKAAEMGKLVVCEKCATV